MLIYYRSTPCACLYVFMSFSPFSKCSKAPIGEVWVFYFPPIRCIAIGTFFYSETNSIFVVRWRMPPSLSSVFCNFRPQKYCFFGICKDSEDCIWHTLPRASAMIGRVRHRQRLCRLEGLLAKGCIRYGNRFADGLNSVGSPKGTSAGRAKGSCRRSGVW